MKISKLNLLLLVFVLAIALSGCGKKTADTTNEQNQNQNQTPKQEEDENVITSDDSDFSASIADMFKKGKSLECTTEIDDSETTMKATYYFDGKNEMMRADISATAKAFNMTFNSVNIIKDGWNYFWDDLMNKAGEKIKLDENETAAESEETVNLDDRFNFSCKEWKVDKSKFDLPADKVFKDITDTLNQ